MKGACGIPRELVSTLDWEGPAIAAAADDMTPAVAMTDGGERGGEEQVEMCWSRQLLHSLASAPVFLPTRGRAFFRARQAGHGQSRNPRPKRYRKASVHPNPRRQSGAAGQCVLVALSDRSPADPHCHYHITSSFTAIITTEATAPLARIGPAVVSVSFPRSAPATSSQRVR